MKSSMMFFTLCFCILSACHSVNAKKENDTSKEPVGKDSNVEMNTPVASVATILAKKQVPVLCYHHIREPKPGQSETMKSYSVSPAQFA
ncbi:MAG: hypothetical protein ABI148_05645, partial [Ginsengibacter sp.]